MDHGERGGRWSDEDLDAPDVVGQGRERPTLGERAHDWVLRGPAAFALRHRLGVAFGTALVIAGTAAGTYVLTRPPPVDPAVRVVVIGTIGEFRDVRGGIIDVGDPLPVSGPYVVKTDVVGDDVEVIGVVGPGLVTPETTGFHVTIGQPARVSLTSKLDCSQPGWVSATADDYRLRVRRTDAYGRLTDDDVPLGTSAKDWRARVLATCVPNVVASLPLDGWSVRAVPGRMDVHLTLRLRNPTDFPLWLQPMGLGFATPGRVVTLNPHATLPFTFSTFIADCTVPSHVLLWESGAGTDYFVPVRAAAEPLQPLPEGTVDSQLAGVVIPQSDADAINSRLNQVCRGAPKLTGTVASVHEISAQGPRVVWGINLRFRADGDALEFGTDRLLPGSAEFAAATSYDDASIHRPGRTPLRGGSADAEFTWAQPTCDELPQSGPPGVLVVLVVGKHRYPTWVSFSGRPMLEAVRRACPGALSSQDVRDYGWVPPEG